MAYANLAECLCVTTFCKMSFPLWLVLQSLMHTACVCVTEIHMSMTFTLGVFEQQSMPILACQRDWSLDSNKASCFVQTEVGQLWAKINSVADDLDHLKQTVPKQASIGGLVMHVVLVPVFEPYTFE